MYPNASIHPHNKQLNRNVEHRRFENGRLHALNPFAEKQKKKGAFNSILSIIGFLVWTRSAAVEAIQVAVLAGTLLVPCIYLYVAGPRFQVGRIDPLSIPISGRVIIIIVILSLS